MKDKRVETAALALRGMQKYLASAGLQKQASNAVTTYHCLRVMKMQENLVEKRSGASGVLMEKQAAEWWDNLKTSLMDFGTKTMGLTPAQTNMMYSGLAGAGLGALGGGLLGRDWRSALVGGLAGGGAGMLGGYNYPGLFMPKDYKLNLGGNTAP